MKGGLSYAQQARLTLIGTALVALALVFQITLSASTRLSTARDDLDRMNRSLLQAANAPADKAGTSDDGLSSGGPNEAGSRFQAAVTAAAQANGFAIENLQMGEPERKGPVLLLNLNANGAIPEPQLFAFLGALLSGKPSVAIAKLDMQKMPETALIDPAGAPAVRRLSLRVKLVSILPAASATAAATP
jgi:hypothetical protein